MFNVNISLEKKSGKKSIDFCWNKKQTEILSKNHVFFFIFLFNGRLSKEFKLFVCLYIEKHEKKNWFFVVCRYFPIFDNVFLEEQKIIYPKINKQSLDRLITSHNLIFYRQKSDKYYNRKMWRWPIVGWRLTGWLLG